MRVSEILRKIADVVDQEDGEQVAEPVAEPVAVARVTVAQDGEAPIEAEVHVDAEEVGMVPPLQQEHELLKKSMGVDNSVSEFVADEENGFDKELESMKQMAGIGEEQNGPHNYAEEMKPVSMNPRAVAATEAHGKQDARLSQTKHKDS